MNYLLIALLIGGLILIHELGHLVAAWIAGIPVARFSIGFGPKLWGKKIGRTEYWIAPVPLGGYVLPAIENEEDYFRLPVAGRILFALGGPVANLLLPVVLYAAMNAAVDGATLSGLFVKPWIQTANITATLLASLPRAFSHPDQLSGMVGIVAIGGEFAQAGALGLARFAIIISLNLAILNLLPLPPLDGGKIVLSLLEKLHPRATRLHYPLAITGWLCLAGLMLYTTALDIARHVVGVAV
ncbi:MAG: site-2 protease family protein [Planctomycetia bacterium]|nr:site-2 protease family protein [Planctomycetia bacterium]